MIIEVNTGSGNLNLAFEPQYNESVLSFYDNLINTYQIVSYKAALDNGTVIHRVVA
jgi:hypothetical protein